MAIAGAYFVGLVAGLLLLLGFILVQKSQFRVLGCGLWIAVVLVTVLGGYVAFGSTLSFSDVYFIGAVAGAMLLLGFNFIQKSQFRVLGYGLWIAVVLVTVLGGYVSFGF